MRSIELSDFTFLPSGHGHYKVTYTSRITGRCWQAVTDNMPLIDVTKNSDRYPGPLVSDLETLKGICKQGEVIRPGAYQRKNLYSNTK